VCFRCGGDGVDPRGALGRNQSLEYGIVGAAMSEMDAVLERESREHEQQMDHLERESEMRAADIDEEMSRLDPNDHVGAEMLQREAELDDAEIQAEMEAEDADYQARMEDLAWEAEQDAQAYDDWGDSGHDDDYY